MYTHLHTPPDTDIQTLGGITHTDARTHARTHTHRHVRSHARTQTQHHTHTHTHARTHARTPVILRTLKKNPLNTETADGTHENFK